MLTLLNMRRLSLLAISAVVVVILGALSLVVIFYPWSGRVPPGRDRTTLLSAGQYQASSSISVSTNDNRGTISTLPQWVPIHVPPDLVLSLPNGYALTSSERVGNSYWFYYNNSSMSVYDSPFPTVEIQQGAAESEALFCSSCGHDYATSTNACVHPVYDQSPIQMNGVYQWCYHYDHWEDATGQQNSYITLYNAKNTLLFYIIYSSSVGTEFLNPGLILSSLSSSTPGAISSSAFY